jgi:hypothetical protein
MGINPGTILYFAQEAYIISVGEVSEVDDKGKMVKGRGGL